MKELNEEQLRKWHKEAAYAYALRSVKGLGAVKLKEQLAKYQSFEGIYENTKNVPIDKNSIQYHYEKLRYSGMFYMPFGLNGYPKKLEEIYQPPKGIFVKNKLPNENNPMVAVIGARNCSYYGEEVAKQLGRKLSMNHIQLISGMARGIDGIVQQSAVENGGDVYAVLGCGADICYPLENERLYAKLAIEKGCGIISEYAPGTKANKKLFPPRNRIISGMCDILVVIEARKKSGTLITVNAALEQGKDVYVVPGRIIDPLSRGCNELMEQGASVIYDIDEFINEITLHFFKKECLKEMGNMQNSSSLLEINEEEKTVLNALDLCFQTLEVIVNKINKECNMSVSKVLQIISSLECKDLVKKEGVFYKKN